MYKKIWAPSKDPDQPAHPGTQWVAKKPQFFHADSQD